MWFRNLLVYRLTQPFTTDAQALQKALEEKRARRCLSQELSTYGFTAPYHKGDALLQAVQGYYLIAARKEERILPNSVIREALAEKVAEIEEQQMRKVYKKEKDQLKDDIIQSLLPRAFSRHQTTCAIITPQQGLIFVDSSSTKRAEELLSALREVLGSLPIRPFGLKNAPSAAMTAWVRDQNAPRPFLLGEECELRDNQEEGGIIRCRRQDLTSEEIGQHLKAGKRVTQLALTWQDKLTFVLDDKFILKRLKFEDLLQEQAEQDGGDEMAAQLDAMLAIMSLTFGELVPALAEALGGEDNPVE